MIDVGNGFKNQFLQGFIQHIYPVPRYSQQFELYTQLVVSTEVGGKYISSLLQ